MTVILKQFFFEFGPLEVNHFILGDTDRGEGILVDAGVYDASIAEFAREHNLDIRTILLTHHHRDHIDALPKYREKWEARIVSPAPLPSAPDARLIEPGQTIQAGPFSFEVFQTSGHSPESVSYYSETLGLAFVGDALFAGAVGGTPQDDLHAEEIGHIQRALLRLPDDTRIYSGHGPATTIAIERAANPFLQPGFTRVA